MAAKGRRSTPQREARVTALASALIELQRRLPQPDPVLEERALDAIADAESLEEGWDSVLARGLVPGEWLDTSRRRFYGVSNRCARCGHPDRCRSVRCLNDERREPLYAHEAFPASWWDLLVVVGHRERIMAAERLSKEYREKLPSALASSEVTGFSLVIETPTDPTRSLSRIQQAMYSDARARAEDELGLPLAPGVQDEVPTLFDQLREQERSGVFTLEAAYNSIADTGATFGGQTYDWIELRCPFSPSAHAARRMPRARPLALTR
ncbi:MAG: hypothetical protein U0269_13460 [Polyangiales bacterium]